MNKQARVEAAARGQSAPIGDAAKGVTDELVNMQAQLPAANAELAKLRGDGVNRTDKPTEIK